MKTRIKRMLWIILIHVLLILTVSGCAGNEEVPAAQETAVQETAKAEVSGQESLEAENSKQELPEAEASVQETAEPEAAASGPELQEDGHYNTRDEVALYLHTYGHLPDNYITKKEAQELGWDSKKGNLEQVAPGMSIGGSHFGNYEKQLPEKKGRKYYECDLGFEGGYRGAERLIYSSDGLIFYTGDHYKTFEQLY